MIHCTLLYVSHENTAFRGNHHVKIEIFVFLAICQNIVAKTGLYPRGLTDSLLTSNYSLLLPPNSCSCQKLRFRLSGFRFAQLTLSAYSASFVVCSRAAFMLDVTSSLKTSTIIDDKIRLLPLFF